MERQLQERLVGATVLVVVMIVVVPLFLDGPAHMAGGNAGTVSEALRLPAPDGEDHVIQLDAPSPTSAAPARREPAPVQPRPGQPEPAANGNARKPPASSGNAQTKPGNSQPTARPAEKGKEPLPAVSGAAQGWAVQVGSFSSEKNARNLAAKLRGNSYSAFHVRKNVGGRILYRVLIGPERDRARAEALATRLRADGQQTSIVQHP